MVISMDWLLHFTLTNPGWKPTGENERYLAGVKEAKGRDLAEIQLQVGLSLVRQPHLKTYLVSGGSQ